MSVPKFNATQYCICLSIDLQYTSADAVQICGTFWKTQYNLVGDPPPPGPVRKQGDMRCRKTLNVTLIS